MDRKIYSVFILLLLILLASGCSKQKEGETKVFPGMSVQCEDTAVKTRYLVKKKNGSFVRVTAKSREEMLEKYVRPKLEELEYVENDQIIYADDYFLRDQGSEVSISSMETWGAERIQASAAWDQGVTGQGVIVAVIDSGVDITHPALASKIYVNEAEKNGRPGVDDDGNGYVDDVNGWDFSVESPSNNDTAGHGTHVSGIIAGESDIMKGVAPNAKILPLDFMDGGSGFTGDAIEAIEYAKKMHARVINASWGSTACSKLLNDAIDSLVSKNILFVAAAGNSGNDLTNYPEFPAAFTSDAQITVGAITSRGIMASFSNYGMPVDVMAPGADILSSYLKHDYTYLSGTSMATPFVTGLAALLVSQNPNLTVAQLKKAIMNSTVRGNYLVKSHGEINVPQALSYARNL